MLIHIPYRTSQKKHPTKVHSANYVKVCFDSVKASLSFICILKLYLKRVLDIRCMQ
nr:MAG TPA: hypothetical protein [Caudoviricetes sp.]